MSALDLDALERLARACVAANEKVDAAPNAYTRWDAEEERRAPHEDLGLHGAEVLALITRLRAAEARADSLRAGTADAQGYARAMGEVVEHLDSLSDAAVATYQEHRTEYADGVADGSVEAWQAVRKLAERD